MLSFLEEVKLHASLFSEKRLLKSNEESYRMKVRSYFTDMVYHRDKENDWFRYSPKGYIKFLLLLLKLHFKTNEKDKKIDMSDFFEFCVKCWCTKWTVKIFQKKNTRTSGTEKTNIHKKIDEEILVRGMFFLKKSLKKYLCVFYNKVKEIKKEQKKNKVLSKENKEWIENHGDEKFKEYICNFFSLEVTECLNLLQDSVKKHPSFLFFLLFQARKVEMKVSQETIEFINKMKSLSSSNFEDFSPADLFSNEVKEQKKRKSIYKAYIDAVFSDFKKDDLFLMNLAITRYNMEESLKEVELDEEDMKMYFKTILNLDFSSFSQLEGLHSNINYSENKENVQKYFFNISSIFRKFIKEKFIKKLESEIMMIFFNQKKQKGMCSWRGPLGAGKETYDRLLFQKIQNKKNDNHFFLRKIKKKTIE